MKKSYSIPSTRVQHANAANHMIAVSAVNINHNDNDAIDAANSLTKGNNGEEQKPWYK